MWDIDKIKQQKKYCLKKLSSNNLTSEEEIKLKLTILSYINMLDSSGTFQKTFFPKIIDLITNGKYQLYKENKYKQLLHVNTSGSVTYDELVFLITLLKKLVTNEIDYEHIEFDKFNINSDELLYIANKYYKDFLDDDISNIALNVLNDHTNINFTKNIRYKKDYLGGNMYMDYIFNNTYINIYEHQDINDYNSIVHETMHCVDYLFKSKNPTKYHKVLNEIPGYTSDFLFMDYLENITFNEIELNKLIKQKVFTNYSLFNNTFNAIKQNYYNKNRIEMTEYSPMELILESLTPEILSNLIEIKSIIISYGLYLQIKEDPQNGLDNFKKYMLNGKPIESDLSFDDIQLSNQKLLDIAEQYMNYSKNITSNSKPLYK